MLQTFHYSSTIQIDTKIQAQFQEFKYGWLACIDNKKQLLEKTTTISANPDFFLKHIGDAFQAHLCLLSSHV